MYLYIIIVILHQDRLYKEYIQLSQVQEKLIFTNQQMQEVLPVISDDGAMKVYERSKDVQYLELVAKVRFGLCVAADMLYTYYWNSDNINDLTHYEKEALRTLITLVKKVCHDKGVKTEPSRFLAKQIVRQFGFPCLEKLCQLENFRPWIMPVGISSKKVYTCRNNWDLLYPNVLFFLQDCGMQGMDMFTIYSSDYTTLRTKVVYSPQEVNMEEFGEELKVRGKANLKQLRKP